jgi:AAA domain-containing protein/bifunctional DNA primase/polymerase-like protein
MSYPRTNASSSSVVPFPGNQTDAPSWDPKWTTRARQALLQHGYEPTPECGKRAVLGGWTDLSATAEDIDAWENSHPNAVNTGILTRHCPAIDIDVLNQEVAEIIHGWVKELIPPGCPELVRIGFFPKRAILFRCDTPFAKLSTGKWIDKDDPKIEHELEILCLGQKITVYGNHPDTGHAYIWTGDRPGQTPRTALPLLTEDMARSLVDRAKALFKERGWQPKREERPKEPPRPRSTGSTDGDAQKISAALAERIEELCHTLLPNGVRRGCEWDVGSINGEEGKSLRIHLSGEKAGVWKDFATDESGDALSLVKAVNNYSTIEAMDWARSWLGWPSREPPSRGENIKKNTTPGTGPTSSSAGAAPTTASRTAVLAKADQLKPETINWAWKNRFAFGKLAVIAGDPGLGKSTVLIEIAALHSVGGEFPCGEGRAQQCESVILTAEDGLRDTLVPRLIAAGADLSKIHFLTGVKTEGSDDETLFDLSRDIEVLRKLLLERPNIKLLIIDPLTAYLGATRAKENSEVRRVLAPLVRLIEETGVACIANNHLNKGQGKAIYRVLDSVAFVAVGRIVHLIIEDADNHDNRKFLCDKTNIGSKPLGLTYIIQKAWIEDKETGEPIETSRICWGTQHIDETADEALEEASEPTHKDDAINFLRQVLADGPMTVSDIEAEARSARVLAENQSISQSKPFRAAREVLGIVPRRTGFGPAGSWSWALPSPVDAS